MALRAQRRTGPVRLEVGPPPSEDSESRRHDPEGLATFEAVRVAYRIPEQGGEELHPGKTISLEIDAAHEDLLRRYADFLQEMTDLAGGAPDGSVLEVCEAAVVERGREHQRRLLQHAVQTRLDVAEKKGRR